MSTHALAPIDTKEIETNLAAIIARSQALVVRDQNTFVDARTLQKDLDGYMKRVGFELDPGIAKAKDVLDHLKDQKEKFIAPARAAKESIRQRADEWASEEKRRAAAEQERINVANRAEAARIAAEERKAAEAQAEIERKQREKELAAQVKAGEIGKRQAERDKKALAEEEQRQKALIAQQEKEAVANVQKIRVAPMVPTVAGIKNQTYYFGAVEVLCRILDEYDMAIRRNDTDRFMFLRKFLTIDDQAIGRFARETKDNAKASALVPGCRFWSKG